MRFTKTFFVQKTFFLQSRNSKTNQTAVSSNSRSPRVDLKRKPSPPKKVEENFQKENFRVPSEMRETILYHIPKKSILNTEINQNPNEIQSKFKNRPLKNLDFELGADIAEAKAKDAELNPPEYKKLKKKMANKIFGYLARCEGKFRM